MTLNSLSPICERSCYMETILESFFSSPQLALTTGLTAHTWPWGAGGQWSVEHEPILTRLVVYCHFVSCIDQWLWCMIMWHHTVKHSMATHIWSLLICSGDFWPRLIDVTHVWSPLSTAPSGLATHYVVKLFIVLQYFKHHRNLEEKIFIASFKPHIIELLKYVWQRENNVTFLVSIHLVSHAYYVQIVAHNFMHGLIRLKIIAGSAHAMTSRHVIFSPASKEGWEIGNVMIRWTIFS